MQLCMHNAKKALATNCERKSLSDSYLQQKIAECLTSLDELISANGRKLDALKTHEKGLMRQFFPLGAETIPRLRFPEFSNAPEWSEYTLVDVASVDT